MIKQFDEFYKQLSGEEKSKLVDHIINTYTNLNVVMEGYNSGTLAILDGLNAGPLATLSQTNKCNGCGRPL